MCKSVFILWYLMLTGCHAAMLLDADIHDRPFGSFGYALLLFLGWLKIRVHLPDIHSKKAMLSVCKHSQVNDIACSIAFKDNLAR